MAIVMNMAWAGVTPAQYDAVRRESGFEEDAPDGGILHVARFDDGGLRVTDVWESAGQFDTFVGTRLMPAVAKVGLPGQPEVTTTDCLAYQVETRPSRVRCVAIDGALPMSTEMYRALEVKADWVTTPPIGGISHIAWADGDMLRTLDVWRTVDDCEAFVDKRLFPAMQALGWPLPTEQGPAPTPVYSWYYPAGR